MQRGTLVWKDDMSLVDIRMVHGQSNHDKVIQVQFTGLANIWEFSHLQTLSNGLSAWKLHHECDYDTYDNVQKVSPIICQRIGLQDDYTRLVLVGPLLIL